MRPSPPPLRHLARTCAALALTLALATLPARAQSLLGGAEHVALAGAMTALPGDGWGAANPATWASLEGQWVGLFASEAYGLSELRYGAAQAATPLWGNVLAAGVQTFGFEDYRETTFLGGAARSLSLGTSRQVHVGVAVRVQNASIPGYGSALATGVSLGVQVNVLPSLDFGVSGLNINGPEMAGENAMDRTLSMGLAYSAAEQAMVLADIVKVVDRPSSVRVGVLMTPHRILRLRAGVATEPTRFAGGVGVALGPLRADVAAEQHQDLGWSPALSLQTTW